MTTVQISVSRAGRLPTDGAFFAAVAEGAGCGILLDLHNLWCNERNGRQAPGGLVAAGHDVRRGRRPDRPGPALGRL